MRNGIATTKKLMRDNKAATLSYDKRGSGSVDLSYHNKDNSDYARGIHEDHRKQKACTEISLQKLFNL